MASRYDQLSQAIARLAAPPAIQDECLRSEGFGIEYGNDELALVFSDIYLATNDMLSCGELTQEQVDAVKPLDALLTDLSSTKDSAFWKRQALWSDPRWEQVRRCAAIAYTKFAA